MQSLFVPHALPAPQAGQLPPPQSMAVSVPSLMPSLHSPMHLLPWQTLPAEQSPSAMHGTQVPAWQSLPPLSVHAVRSGAFCVPQAPPAQVAMMQLVPVVGQLEELRHCTQSPLPLQSCPPISAQATPEGAGLPTQVPFGQR